MKIVEEYSKHFIQLKQDINMASTNGRRCTEALIKVEPINQPYIMMLWYNDCAPGPNPEDAGLIPASITGSIFLYKYYRICLLLNAHVV